MIRTRIRYLKAMPFQAVRDQLPNDLGARRDTVPIMPLTLAFHDIARQAPDQRRLHADADVFGMSFVRPL